MNVPDGWRVERLGDVAEFRNGMNFLRSETGHDVSIVGVGDFVGRETINDSDALNVVSVSKAPAHDDYLAPGDLLFVRSNGSKDLVGRCIQFKGNAESAVFSGFTIRARVNSVHARASYVSTVVRSGLFREHLRRLGGGSSINNLSQAALAEFRFVSPPLPEQREIAEILRTWDDAIERVVRTRQLGLAQISEARRKLFSEVHVDPSAADTVALGDIFTERVELGGQSSVLLSVTQRQGVIRQDVAGRKNSSSADRSKYKLVKPGDIAYNTMRMWQGASGVVSEEGIISPAYTVVVPDTSKIGLEFAAQLFKSDRMLFDFERYSQGLTSDTWNLKYPAFSEIRITLPSLERQQQVSNALDSMNAELALLDRQLDLLRTQKRGLMQKLLTGDIRVTGDETQGE